MLLLVLGWWFDGCWEGWKCFDGDELVLLSVDYMI